MPTSLPSGMNASSLTGGDAEKDEKRAQQEEMKRQLLTQILDTEARERCMYSLTDFLYSVADCSCEATKGRRHLRYPRADGTYRPSSSARDRRPTYLSARSSGPGEHTGVYRQDHGTCIDTLTLQVTRKKTFDDSDDDWDL